MARAPFQVLILLFRYINNKIEYCIFNRADSKHNLWQFISGGGENSESINEAAIRELYEETGIEIDSSLIKLNNVADIPTKHFNEIVIHYPKLKIIPEYCFAAEIKKQIIKLSSEHTEFIWTDYENALKLLEFESNKTALHELSLLLKQVNK